MGLSLLSLLGLGMTDFSFFLARISLFLVLFVALIAGPVNGMHHTHYPNQGLS